MGVLILREYNTKGEAPLSIHPPLPITPAQVIYLLHPPAMSSLMVIEVICIATSTICAGVMLMSKGCRGWQGTGEVMGEGKVAGFNSQQSRGGPSHSTVNLSYGCVLGLQGNFFRLLRLIPYSRSTLSRSPVTAPRKYRKILS